MDRITINTTQNVHIDYEAAGIGDRSIAAILDVFILLAYVFSVSMVLDEASSWVLYALIALPYFIYFLIAEIFFNGQTLGKKMRGIK